MRLRLVVPVENRTAQEPDGATCDDSIPPIKGGLKLNFAACVDAHQVHQRDRIAAAQSARASMLSAGSRGKGPNRWKTPAPLDFPARSESEKDHRTLIAHRKEVTIRECYERFVLWATSRDLNRRSPLASVNENEIRAVEVLRSADSMGMVSDNCQKTRRRGRQCK